MSIDLRAVFVLFELEQTTLSEIAVLLDVPRGTVASRLRRAREYYESATRPSTRGRNGEGI
jgi:RNA polymerase sigma-70 factor (ECF subfamily)